jgi:hypothetical protein
MKTFFNCIGRKKICKFVIYNKRERSGEEEDEGCIGMESFKVKLIVIQ